MSTQVSIEAPDQQALAAMAGDHAELRRELDDRVRALRIVVRTRAEYQPQLTALKEFVDERVLPHAAAEEETLYPAAETDAPLFVEAMRAEHRRLADAARVLDHARSSVEALAAAEGFAAVFHVHVDNANEQLLPFLDRAAGARLAELHEAMQERLNELRDADDTADR